jgi:putative DNA primase/helicase
MNAAELAARFGLRRNGREFRGACPCCGKPSLTIEDKAGKTFWRCFYGCDQGALTRAILGGDVPHVPASSPSREPRGETSSAAALGMWERAVPLVAGDPAMNYLMGRHVPPPPDAPIRKIYGAKHPSGARMPCMICLVVDAAGRGVALHRTFLAPDGSGKARVDPVRMTLGPVRGGAVRLYPPGPRLVVAEGIETALSAALLLKLPAWAAVSAGNLADALTLPAEVREVVISADHDVPGRSAAQRAAARWKAEGRRVRIALPDKPGCDFNDILRGRVTRGG